MAREGLSEESEEKLEARIRQALRELNFSSRYVGFEHLTRAVAMAYEAPDCLRNLTAGLYPEIARRAGVSGMVAGQSIDLLSEHREPNEATLQYIHTHKTADLLTAPLLAAAYIAGADEKAISALETFGLCVGLAFQIDDDLLDVLGDAKDLGKQTGMDAQRGKMTWPSLVGVEAAQKKSRELWTRAEEALSVFGDSAWFLRAFAEALAKRKK